jgi:hypothetical protein
LGRAANPHKKGVNFMRTYWIKVSVPAYYVIDAETEKEAAHKALSQYTEEYKTGEIPQVHAVKELTEDDLDKEAICEGASCKDELEGMLKYR